MRLFLLLVLLSGVIVNIAWRPVKKPVLTPKILQEYPFIMTPEQRMKMESETKSVINGYKCNGISKKILGYDAKLRVHSSEHNGIPYNYRRFVIPLKKEKDTRKYIQQFDYIKKLLIKKYGTSYKDESKYRSVVYIKKYKKKMDGKELAFEDNQYTYLITWKFEKFKVLLKLYKTRNHPIINLEYGSVPQKTVSSLKKKPSNLDEL